MRSTFAILKKRFDAFDDRLDAWADRHWPVLSVLGTTLSFVMLSGGVALHAYQSGFAHAAGMRCGQMCVATSGFEPMAAALCGAAAILFVKLYAEMTAAVQRTFIDPFKYVRPEPPTRSVTRWAAAFHVAIGFALFLAMAGFAKQQIPGTLLELSVESPGGFKATLGDRGSLELVLGWWIGGLFVLRFFWPTYSRGGDFTRESRR